jgi:DNA polymerase I-like protein with 3'-5' exonuclease and polymerase domains
VLPCHRVPARKVLPTYHPADVVKQWDWRPIAVADLKKAAVEATFSGIRRPQRTIWVAESLRDLETFDRLHLSKATSIAFDIETALSQITCISLAPSPRVCLVVPIWDKRKPGYSFWSRDDEIKVRVWLHKILGRSILHLGQNILYDLTYLSTEGIRVNGEIGDTMLAAHSLEPEMDKDLGFLASLHTSEASWKLMNQKRKADREKSDE